jgi:hypothetical protein
MSSETKEPGVLSRFIQVAVIPVRCGGLGTIFAEVENRHGLFEIRHREHKYRQLETAG